MNTLRTALVWLFRGGGVVMLANGLWMLANALHWFTTLPAGLPDTGPPNGHLIRDVGLAYLIFGAAVVWATFDLRARRVAFVGTALFMVGHALAHVAELLVGSLPPSHWLLDLPLVLVPALLFGVFMHPAAWRWLSQAPIRR